jgi:hypothetical protein
MTRYANIETNWGAPYPGHACAACGAGCPYCAACDSDGSRVSGRDAEGRLDTKCDSAGPQGHRQKGSSQ